MPLDCVLRASVVAPVAGPVVGSLVGTGLVSGAVVGVEEQSVSSLTNLTAAWHRSRALGMVNLLGPVVAGLVGTAAFESSIQQVHCHPLSCHQIEELD